MRIFAINEDYIPLIQLLKASRIAQSGGDAQRLVEEGMVTINGNREERKRAKLRHGDVVTCKGVSIRITSERSIS